jgi:hypothetical protein
MIDLYLIKDILVFDNFLPEREWKWFTTEFYAHPSWWHHSWNMGHDKNNESMWMWHKPLACDENHRGT